MQIVRVGCWLGVLWMNACQPKPAVKDPIQFARQKAGVEVQHMDLSVSPRQDFKAYRDA